jgi:hypothetical protein
MVCGAMGNYMKDQGFFVDQKKFLGNDMIPYE